MASLVGIAYSAPLPGRTLPPAACTTTALTYHRASGRATYTILQRVPESGLFERGEVNELARPRTLNGGAKPIFPRAMDDVLGDLRAFRQEVEQAEAIADDPRQSPSVRRKWREYRDLMQTVIDVRIGLGEGTVRSHERAISGCASTLCRSYEVCNPSVTELQCAARRQMQNVRTASHNPDAA